MNGQLVLGEGPQTRPYLSARISDAPTSVAAAAQLTGKVDREVLFHFRVTGRAYTDDKLAAELPHLYSQTVKSARSRLSKAGYLEHVGEGLSARGKPARTHRIKGDQ